MSGKNTQPGNTDMLLLNLLSREDMYGYEMIEVLDRQSDHIFQLKAGTLYPLLHQLENRGYLISYDKVTDGGKTRKYYHLTEEGELFLQARNREWNSYSAAVNRILYGGKVIAQT